MSYQHNNILVLNQLYKCLFKKIKNQKNKIACRKFLAKGGHKFSRGGLKILDGGDGLCWGGLPPYCRALKSFPRTLLSPSLTKILAHFARYISLIATLGSNLGFQLCLKSCNLASWTTKWHDFQPDYHPPNHPPTHPTTNR